MKNVIFLVLDSLSREYIEKYPLEKNNFFEYLDNNSICFKNMYSMAPFTEGALPAVWNSSTPLEQFWGNCIEKDHNKSMFTLFSEAGYEIYGRGCQYFDLSYMEEHDVPSSEIVRSRAHWLLPKLKYFVQHRECTYRKQAIINTLDLLFAYPLMTKEAEFAFFKMEAEKYFADKESYYMDIIQRAEKHEIFSIAKNVCFKPTLPPDNKEDMEYPITEEEYLLAGKINHKNRRLILEYNKDKADSIELINQSLRGEVFNRDIYNNTNALNLMRTGVSRRKDSQVSRGIIEARMDKFFEKNISMCKKPYFASFHDFSFHDPEFFINAFKDEDKYKEEVKKCLEILPQLKMNKISVIRALSLVFINNWLENFIEYLKERDIFKDTYLVITADHGISNFMYPVDREYRWAFYKENFHIPLWIIGADIKPVQYDKLCTSNAIAPTLMELCGLENTTKMESLFHVDNEYILTEWMNGIADIENNDIKFGYRNNKISLTYNIRLNQIFSSGKLLTLFDLENDKSEEFNLNKKEISEDIQFEVNKALKIIHERWNHLQKKYLNPKYRMITEELNISIEIMSMEKLSKEDREVILYGTDDVADSFLQQFGKYYNIKRIISVLDKNKYFLGRKIERGIHNTDVEDSNIIVACRDEIDAIYNLYNWGVKKIYIYTK